VKVLSRVPPSPPHTASQIATLCDQSYIIFSKENNFMFRISSVVPFSVNHICQLNQLLRTGNLVAVSNKKTLISEPPILK
jgi:hypothetical protein